MHHFSHDETTTPWPPCSPSQYLTLDQQWIGQVSQEMPTSNMPALCLRQMCLPDLYCTHTRTQGNASDYYIVAPTPHHVTCEVL